MTATITTEMRDHLDQSVTQLATLFKIVRKDGMEFLVTDHDVDLTVGSETYRANGGFIRSTMAKNAGLAVDDVEVTGSSQGIVFENVEIEQEDLIAGKFDGARVYVSRVVWSDLSIPPMKDNIYFFGPVTTSPNGIFRVQMFSLAVAAQQGVIRGYVVKCPADLGDGNCQIPISPDIIQRDTLYLFGDYVRIPTDEAVATTLQNGDPTQDAFENRIYRCIVSGSTAEEETVQVTAEFDFTETGGLIDRDAGSFIDDNVRIGMRVEFTGNATNPGPFTVLTVGATQLTVEEAVVDQADYTGDADFYVYVDTAIGELTIDGGAVFQAEDAWMRHATVSVATEPDNFTINVSEARAVDDWFNYGALIFESGQNAGFASEIKDWDAGESRITLFPPYPPFPITVGDKIRLYAGCDKRDSTCNDKFANIINYRGFNQIPGQKVLTQVE